MKMREALRRYGSAVLQCHIHLIPSHLIPRRKGDTPDPRGGQIIPSNLLYILCYSSGGRQKKCE